MAPSDGASGPAPSVQPSSRRPTLPPRALAARVDLHHLVGAPEAQRPALRVGLGDRRRHAARRRRRSAPAPRPACRRRPGGSAGSAAATRGRRSRTPARACPAAAVAIADRAVQALGDLAVARPGHAAVDARPAWRAARAGWRRPRPARAAGTLRYSVKMAQPSLRSARQLQQRPGRSACLAKASRDTGLPSSCWSVHVHALRDVEHHHMLEQRTLPACSRGCRKHAGQQQRRQRRAASGRGRCAPRCAQRRHSRPFMAGPANSRAWWWPRARRCAARLGRLVVLVLGVGQQALRALEVVARVPVLGVVRAAPRGSSPWPARSARCAWPGCAPARIALPWRISRLALL